MLPANKIIVAADCSRPRAEWFALGSLPDVHAHLISCYIVHFAAQKCSRCAC